MNPTGNQPLPLHLPCTMGLSQLRLSKTRVPRTAPFQQLLVNLPTVFPAWVGLIYSLTNGTDITKHLLRARHCAPTLTYHYLNQNLQVIRCALSQLSPPAGIRPHTVGSCLSFSCIRHGLQSIHSIFHSFNNIYCVSLSKTFSVGKTLLQTIASCNF